MNIFVKFDTLLLYDGKNLGIQVGAVCRRVPQRVQRAAVQQPRARHLLRNRLVNSQIIFKLLHRFFFSARTSEIFEKRFTSQVLFCAFYGKLSLPFIGNTPLFLD